MKCVNRQFQSRLAAVAVHAALVLLAVATLLPLVWMVAASFMTPGEASAVPLRFLPRRPTLANYAALFERLDVARYLANSMLVAVATTGLSVAVNTMAGYAFAQLRFPGRDRVFRWLVVAMIVPFQVAMLPLFLLMKELGLVNTYLGAILPAAASLLGIFLMRQFVRAVPEALLDAARLDGASEGRVFLSVVLPLARPALVTLALLTFMTTWNDFLWPLIVFTDASLYTLPVGLASLAGERVQDRELMMAGAVLTMVPVVVVYLALQRHFEKGILPGALKE